jgi:hypothetical protein
MSVAKTLSSTLFLSVIAGIPLMAALLFIGSVHARNDGFKGFKEALSTLLPPYNTAPVRLIEKV